MQTKFQKAAEKAAREARYEKARTIVRSGVCPICGAGLRRNLSITGWWQCSQYGSAGFRRDGVKPECSFQTFTE